MEKIISAISKRKDNKYFWIGLVSVVLVMIQEFLKILGISTNFNLLDVNIVNFINALFAVLAFIGVVINPTTPGLTDSDNKQPEVNPDEKIDKNNNIETK